MSEPLTRYQCDGKVTESTEGILVTAEEVRRLLAQVNFHALEIRNELIKPVARYNFIRQQSVKIGELCAEAGV